MTDKKQTLYVWEDNAAAVVWAVQGENKSRKLELTLIETKGGDSSQWGAEVIDKPLDLTGMSVPRLYVSKPDSTSVLTDGEIVDAKKGMVSFALTAEQLAVPGTATCQVVLTKPDGEVLKVIGMQLDIQRSNLDGAGEGGEDYKSVVIVLDRATKAAELAEAATVTANTAGTEGRDCRTKRGHESHGGPERRGGLPHSHYRRPVSRTERHFRRRQRQYEGRTCHYRRQYREQ